jgi:TRAP transporter TAXI family solute receptor
MAVELGDLRNTVTTGKGQSNKGAEGQSENAWKFPCAPLFLCSLAPCGGHSVKRGPGVVRAVLAAALLVISGCRTADQQPPVQVVRMATILGRIMTPLAAALTKVLPERYPARIEVQKITNSGDYARLIETGQIELAMIQTDLAYFAYTQGLGDSPQPMRRLRGVAVLYTTPLRLLATKSSKIRNVMDIRGKRVFAGMPGSPTEFTVKMTLQALGLTFNDFEIKRMPDTDLVPALKGGRIDALFYRGNDPYPLIQQIIDLRNVSFVSMSRDQVETNRAHHPFLRSISVPAGMYGEHPEIATVGGDMLLVCRADLPDELVYWITRTLFDSLPELADSLPALRQIDPERVQASPVPLHGGATRFYRERELFP